VRPKGTTQDFHRLCGYLAKSARRDCENDAIDGIQCRTKVSVNPNRFRERTTGQVLAVLAMFLQLSYL
jgi:hypothetical protein